MSQLPPPPIPAEEMAALPPEFRALLQRVIDHYERRIAKLEAELRAVRKTPQNSSRPPSSQPPRAKPVPSASSATKKRGGQPGHPKHERSLIPAHECDAVVALRPPRSAQSSAAPAGGR